MRRRRMKASRRMLRLIIHRHIMRTWLTDASCSDLGRILVDCALHGSKQLVEVHQIILSAQVVHWWQGVMTSIRVLVTPADTDGLWRCMELLRQEWKVQALKGCDPALDLLVRSRIKTATLMIWEEPSQDLEAVLD